MRWRGRNEEMASKKRSRSSCRAVPSRVRRKSGQGMICHSYVEIGVRKRSRGFNQNRS